MGNQIQEPGSGRTGATSDGPMVEPLDGPQSASPGPLPFRKRTGLAHLLAASRYSAQGFRRLLKESAFRQELLAFGLAAVLFLAVGASALEILGLTLLMLVLFAVEALNTAIEEVIDRISPEFSIVARNAKDLGSFAVFCLLAANTLYVLTVLWNHLPLSWP